MKKKLIPLLIAAVVSPPGLLAQAERPRPVFHSAGPETRLSTTNGFAVRTTTGHFAIGERMARGVLASVQSPWGETMDLQFFLQDDALIAKINERISVTALLDSRGKLAEMMVDDGETLVRSRIDNRAERFAFQGLSNQDLDLSAYMALWDALRQDHSDAFLHAFGRMESDTLMPIDCMSDYLQCSAAVVSWILSVGTVIAACGSATGVPLVTLGCLAAIFAHEVNNLSLILSCGGWAICLQREEDNDPPDGNPIHPDDCDP